MKNDLIAIPQKCMYFCKYPNTSIQGLTVLDGQSLKTITLETWVSSGDIHMTFTF